MDDARMRTPRLVVPRRDVVAGIAVTAGAAVVAPQLALAQGEGEGGEGAVAEQSGTAALLTALGLVEGHLMAGTETYGKGEVEMATTHMKHPGDEIYTDLEPMLDRYGAPGFADELQALADAVEGGAHAAEVEAARDAVREKIAAARAAVAATQYERVKSIEDLLRTAADEYALGIVDGEVHNLHEYQDAWGFVQVAKDEASKLDVPEGVGAAIAEAMAPVDALFPAIVPEGRVDGQSEVLYGAAARVELAGLQLR